MADKFPSTRRPAPTLPVAMQGEIYENIGRYARGAVLFAFEEIGGPRGLAEWAQDNQSDFYTKLFTKVITKETEVTVTRDFDGLMDVLDGDFEVVQGESERISSVPVPAAPPTHPFGPTAAGAIAHPPPPSDPDPSNPDPMLDPANPDWPALARRYAVD